jgi:hypothetical protein
MRAEIKAGPGVDRARIATALREVRGCECPIGEGGTAAVIPGMVVYRLSDDRKMQVSECRPKDQQIRCLDNRDGLTGWLDVRLFSKKPRGLGLKQALERQLNGLDEFDKYGLPR